MFFMGSCSHQIDDKGRIRIPTMFKEALGECPIITIGRNNCLYVYPATDSDKLFARFVNVDGYSDDNLLRAIRKIYPNTMNAVEDKQGRIALKNNLLEHLYEGVTDRKNIVTVGVRDHVEIWTEERWKAYDEDTNIDDIFKDAKKD